MSIPKDEPDPYGLLSVARTLEDIQRNMWERYDAANHQEFADYLREIARQASFLRTRATEINKAIEELQAALDASDEARED